jgi:hypothetical protein
MADSDSFLSRFSEGLILASVPAAGYGLAFVYEAGFCAYHRIPPHLIVPSITTVIVAAGACGMSLLLSVALVRELIANAGKRPHARLFLVVSAVRLIIVSLYSLTTIAPRSATFICIGVVVAFDLIHLVPPALSKALAGTYLDRLEASLANDKTRPLIPTLLQRTHPEAPRLFTLTIFLCFLAYLLGYSAAVSQRDFLVTDSKPRGAVLRIYGDLVITAPVDLAAKRLQASFSFKKVTDLGPVSRLSIGPLTPIETPDEAIAVSPTSPANVAPAGTTDAGTIASGRRALGRSDASAADRPPAPPPTERPDGQANR